MFSNQVLLWSVQDVATWAESEKLSEYVIDCLRKEEIDGCTLIHLTENDIRDLRYKLQYPLKFSDIKKLSLSTKKLISNNPSSASAGSTCCHWPQTNTNYGSCVHPSGVINWTYDGRDASRNDYDNRSSPPLSINGRATSVPPELFKTAVSLGYSFVVTWITSFVMVIVHERVPDMKRYPPLPDIFLDNVPTIPWAFHMCEITGTILFSIWAVVCVFHKYRTVLLRRFFGIAGTVFLLRCVTMLITSLSVPGTHLTCNQNDFKVDDANITLFEAIELRISRAYTIWSGLGMSIQGVRTCGDYMFSGHTVALTLLNFFITEYTPRNLYFLHTMTWLLNMFGIFFILAAHEHYSIDVFVAFYITSRLFLYYHTLANNQALMSHDSNRTRIWFPMFSYLESSVDGIIPNEFDTASSMLTGLFSCVLSIKDSIMLTTRRFWISQPSQNCASAKTSSTGLNNNSKLCSVGAKESTYSTSGLINSRDFQDISKKDI